MHFRCIALDGLIMLNTLDSVWFGFLSSVSLSQQTGLTINIDSLERNLVLEEFGKGLPDLSELGIADFRAQLHNL